MEIEIGRWYQARRRARQVKVIGLALDDRTGQEMVIYDSGGVWHACSHHAFAIGFERMPDAVYPERPAPSAPERVPGLDSRD